ncbi:proliferating cell nuclear antigen (pcna) like protein [Zymoseptoria brevis]|uniref:Vezatin n=1 Tax=Zymoseptoria brevis TaxID=1047168 RepID=A0A0F4G5K2_9PEZI|nr:proliferating cell nuclear antigen (pcna) like protein [Zymoseptoria brevis]
METIYPADSPLAAYLEGEGEYEPFAEDSDTRYDAGSDTNDDSHSQPSFAPPPSASPRPRFKIAKIPEVVHQQQQQQQSRPAQNALARIHDAWSTAVNSRLGRADNERFLEHFRYTIVASQLLNEYLDHGSLHPDAVLPPNVDGAAEQREESHYDCVGLYGATAATLGAMLVALLIDQLGKSRLGHWLSAGRAMMGLVMLLLVGFVGYRYNRRRRLRWLRQQAVEGVSALTTSWQAFELACTSSLSFIQEVELVSKGFRLSTPLPPASRIEGSGASRRCNKLRHVLYKAYSSTIPASTSALNTLIPLIDQDDLERYYEVYDISFADAREALNSNTSLSIFEDDPESLKSLRVLSYRSSILRRITLCALMSLDADGGHPDFHRWHTTTSTLSLLTPQISTAATRLRQTLTEMETITVPLTPTRNLSSGTFSPNLQPTREKIRSQVRGITTLGTGIRGLHAKIQILREETSHAIDASEDLTDLGPRLVSQYDAIGEDIQDLLRAWEGGKKALQTSLSRQENRLSLASMSSSNGMRSPVSSLGGLTAVDETEPLTASGGGGPDDALNSLTGDPASFKLRKSHPHRSSLPTTSKFSRPSSPSSSPSTDPEQPFPVPKKVSEKGALLYEAVALTPSSTMRRQRQRSLAMTREERIARMNEERERQASVKMLREANTSMLRELESVIRLREKLGGNEGLKEEDAGIVGKDMQQDEGGGEIAKEVRLQRVERGRGGSV